MRRDVFQAIADPNRREILAVLAQQTLTLNGVAEKFQISRPAVSKHIKILSECGLVITKQRGRERFCEVQPSTLNEVGEWLSTYNQLWIQRLGTRESDLVAGVATKDSKVSTRRANILRDSDKRASRRATKNPRSQHKTKSAVLA